MIIETRSGKAIVPSPFEVHAYPVTIPPLREELMAGAIRLKLRSFHPGDPSNSEIDYASSELARKPAPKAKRGEISVLAFTALSETIRLLREKSLPILPPTELISEAYAFHSSELSDERKPDAAILESEDWVLVSTIVEGKIAALISFRAPLRQEDSSALNEYLSAKCDGEKPCLLLTWNGAGNVRISDKSAVRLNGDTIALRIDANRKGIFHKIKRDNGKFHRWAIILLCALNAIAILSYANRRVTTLEKQVSEVKAVYDMRKKENARLAELRVEMAKLRAPSPGTTSKTIDDPYAILSVLRKCLHGAWIRSISMQPGSFRIEAEGADSLDVIASLQASKAFTTIALRQSAPSPMKGDVFTIVGEF